MLTDNFQPVLSVKYVIKNNIKMYFAEKFAYNILKKCYICKERRIVL